MISLKYLTKQQHGYYLHNTIKNMKTTKLIFVTLIVMNLVGYIVAQNHVKPEKELVYGLKLVLFSEKSLDKAAPRELLKAEEYKVRIACVGNSITKGSHLNNPTKECYPSQLSDMLSSVYGDTCIVNNYGLSGRNMLKNGPSPIWNEPKFREALNWMPDICFILLGTNDSRPDLWKKSGNEFLEDYLNMIDTFKTWNPETRFIIGAPTPIWEGHPYGGDAWGEKHNDSILVNCIIPLINVVSEKTDAVLVDFHTPFKDSINLFPDHLHPNMTGANNIAKMIFKTIEEKDMIHIVKESKD